MVFVIVFLSLAFDGILTNFLPYLEGDLSYFTPLLTVVTIPFIYPFFRKKEKKYYIGVFLLGILYDLCFTNLIFWNGILFLGIAFLSKILYKNYGLGPLKIVIYSALLVIAYESMNAIIIWIFQLVPITISELIYKITHTYLLNMIYMELIYVILKIIPEKYKKISIN
jgi:cell shape-determining protein MreD